MDTCVCELQQLPALEAACAPTCSRSGPEASVIRYSSAIAQLSTCLLAVSTLPALPVVIALFFAAVGLLGMGNGAVFQLVPQRFPDRMGIVTGIVGAAGGLGGFFLPSVLGATNDLSGTYSIGLQLFALALIAGALLLLQLGTDWKARWQPHAVEQSGIFCLRGAVQNLFDNEAA